MSDLSDKTRDDLLVAVACGLSALLKAAAAGDISDDERDWSLPVARKTRQEPFVEKT